MKKILFTLALLLVAFTAKAQSCPDDNHPHAIDLGVGLKFSCCNIGASKPEDYGEYYAWGEIEEKDVYSLDNYLYGSYDQSGSQTFTQIGDIYATQYDVAYSKWGDTWRIPTGFDMEMLYMKCRFVDATVNGVDGIKFTGMNGNSIFLPFAGNKDSNTSNGSPGKSGDYWLSLQHGDSKAQYLSIKNNRSVWEKDGERYIGRTVRPVYIDKTSIHSCPDGNHPHAIDLGLPSGTKWACCNVGATDPIQNGEYFSWGETKQKDTYNFETYPYCHGADGIYTSWDFLGEDIGGTQYDAAYVNWGENWRMPSLDDIKELVNNCEYVPDEKNIHGLVFTGPNGQSIFLPSGDMVYSDNLANVLHNRQKIYIGYYWTSSQNMDYSYDPGFGYTGYEFLAFNLVFLSVPFEAYPFEHIDEIEVCNYRIAGMNIRPIQNITSSIEMTQQSNISLQKGIYTVQGMKLSDDTKSATNLPKGIYIVNGKKYVIK